jgi:anti-sigma B factor antagonist
LDLELSTEARGGWMVVRAQGEIDIYTGPKLWEAILSLVDQGHHEIAIDLEGVEFMDSTGLGVLITALTRLREHAGKLVLVAPRVQIRTVLSITGMEKVLTIHDALEELDPPG